GPSRADEHAAASSRDPERPAIRRGGPRAGAVSLEGGRREAGAEDRLPREAAPVAVIHARGADDRSSRAFGPDRRVQDEIGGGEEPDRGRRLKPRRTAGRFASGRGDDVDE